MIKTIKSNQNSCSTRHLTRSLRSLVLFIGDFKKMTNDSNLFLLFFLSTVFTLVISAISHLKEDKISFSEKIYFASKNPWILNHAKKWHTICINYRTTFDSETAWAWMDWSYKETFQDKIFLILWARHPESLAEKETNIN